MVPFTINTQRLGLRTLNEDDLESILTLIREPSIASCVAFLPHAFKTQEAFAKQWIHRSKEGSLKQQEWILGLELPTYGLIGNVALHRRQIPGTFELGYWLHPEYQGKGYVTEACLAVIQFAFKQQQAESLYATCTKNNTASQKVLLKLGFSYVSETMVTTSIGEQRSSLLFQIVANGGNDRARLKP